MYFYRRAVNGVVAVILFGSVHVSADSGQLSLQQAVSRAQADDPWLVANRHRQQAIESMAIASAVMPEPKVSVAMNNLALDSFDFNQEAMTQLKFGISQTLPRGDSLAINKQQLKQSAGQYPFLRQDRKAKVAIIVGKLWFDIYKAQQSIHLIEQNRALFEQLADVAQASYSSAIGKTRQQDIVRAQLELARLDDKLTALEQKRLVHRQSLGEWVGVALTESLPDKMPRIKPKGLSMPNFEFHPAVQALNQQVKAGSFGIDLAKQQYRPQWTLNASYGYRGDAPSGMDRADLFSVGVSLDVPLFSEQKQDKQVAAAVSRKEAVKTEKLLLLRQFQSRYQVSKVQYQQLGKRELFYQEKLLPQSSEQAEAALTAYTNDDGDFAEVVRARIDQLNAQIELLDITVERQKAALSLNYFYVGDGEGGIL